ncbi:hypothetical protein GPECTOR_314g8 [Gonium pectorale]|uniref:Guanylate cyclase domain-containing protein n=1 Tax=Gonium pectorale TaxID=33097 RepID=A0A150FXE0_GONPE|nr:hypothetical protein GPECTOR_314g8 [Gonium pectorale]|eukprot:KXZ41700.1 hypothetical protein GPECTOR_314g8 [Gonium pectorale]
MRPLDGAALASPELKGGELSKDRLSPAADQRRSSGGLGEAGKSTGGSGAGELHPFRAYEKHELVRLLRDSGKPAAAILLQPVAEGDTSVPAPLLLDVDPSMAEAISGTPELLVALQAGSRNGGGVMGSVLQHHAVLPPYLRLRLYMLHAWAARPLLAHANNAARSLFEVRSDRQLQLVLEAQLMQDATLAMLLQELLDELLTAPTERASTSCSLMDLADSGGDSSGGGVRWLGPMLRSLSHFVTTNNARVFPFVPVTLRGCGYKKSSGDVVPCVIIEFAPDSNQGAFLEHLQRDYTMLGRMNAIVTLFTLKGDVLHQNAGWAQGAAASGSGRLAKSLLGSALRTLASTSPEPEEPTVLDKLFQYSAPDTLEAMLEAMVQGSVWRSILPVPASLATGARPGAGGGGGGGGLASVVGANPDADSILTAEMNIFSTANIENFAAAVQSTDRVGVGGVFEGSFGLARNSSRTLGTAASGGLGGSGLGGGGTGRQLKAVPEQGGEEEQLSVPQSAVPVVVGLVRAAEAGEAAQTAPDVKAAAAAAAATTAAGTVAVNRTPSSSEAAARAPIVRKASAASAGQLPADSRSGSKPLISVLAAALTPRRSSPSAADGKQPLRRSTTYSSIPYGGAVEGMRPCNSAVGGVAPSLASFTAGSVGMAGAGLGGQARLARLRRRSGLVDDMFGEALSQSTWGLLGSSACDPKYASTKEPLAADSGGDSSARGITSATRLGGTLSSALGGRPGGGRSADRFGALQPVPSPGGQTTRTASQTLLSMSQSQAVWPHWQTSGGGASPSAPSAAQQSLPLAAAAAGVANAGNSRPDSSRSAASSSRGPGPQSPHVGAATAAAAAPAAASSVAVDPSGLSAVEPASPTASSLPGRNPATASELRRRITASAYPACTSFSFGSKAGHRPLVRMMSFLNAPSQLQQQQQHPHGASLPASGHAAFGGLSSFAGLGSDRASRAGSGRHAALAESFTGGHASSLRLRDPSPAGSAVHSSSVPRRASLRHAHSSALIVSPADSNAANAVGLAAGGGGGGGRPLAPPPSLVSPALALGVSNSGGGASGNNGSSNVAMALVGYMADEDRQYHEITATPFMDPVTKSQAIMVVQTDVTSRVRLERRLAEVMEAEHRLLENIFPRHVLEHIAASTAATSLNATLHSASHFNLQMLTAMPDPTKTATDHAQVTILFADIVGFTSMCKEVPAKAVMKFLNDLYTRFDTLLDIYGVYKVETIGDCYMVAGGLMSKDADGFASVRTGSNDNLQAWRVVSFAKAMLRDAAKVLLPTTKEPVKMRVGIHTGPVVSGVVGTRMPRFCLFGDTINTASRMESTCPYGRIQVSAATHALVPGEEWEPTGGVQVKGKGIMETFLLRSAAPDLLSAIAAGCCSVRGIDDDLPSFGTGRGRGLALGPGLVGGRRKQGTSATGAPDGSSGADPQLKPLPLPLATNLAGPPSFESRLELPAAQSEASSAAAGGSLGLTASGAVQAGVLA